MACDGSGFPTSFLFRFISFNNAIPIRPSNNHWAGEAIQNLCVKTINNWWYIFPMGFGNPYGDLYNEEIVFAGQNKLAGMGIGIISLDTVGLATPERIATYHQTPRWRIAQYRDRRSPAFDTGQLERELEAHHSEYCRRFDGALKGIGGCPMADDELVGNMDTNG